MTDTMDLPAPRLQLRWRKPTKAEEKRESIAHLGACHWTCVYEMVLPLRETDIRRTKRKKELVLQIGRTFMSSSKATIPTEAPFRDGAHAGWDSAALGGIPVYVIDADGVPHMQPNKGARAA